MHRKAVWEHSVYISGRAVSKIKSQKQRDGGSREIGLGPTWTRCSQAWSLSWFFHSEGGDALEQVAQGGFGCSIPGGIQGQAGCGPGQPGLLVGDPAHSRKLKLGDRCRRFQPTPFYDPKGFKDLRGTLLCIVTPSSSFLVKSLLLSNYRGSYRGSW